MALRDQPYLPLYIKDFLTDEKLMECSAAATGVYIRIMCVMHKSDPYGTILLRQKDKQTGQQITDFAAKLARHFPYPLEIILLALGELLNENCLFIEGDYLVQKRMVRDGDISVKRSKSGGKGGEVTKKKYKSFAIAKPVANTAIENEDLLDTNINKGGDVFCKKPLPGHFNGLPEIKTGSAIQLLNITQGVLVSTADISGLWEVFKNQNLTGKKFYETEDDVYSHFLNWVKGQKIHKDGKRTTTAVGKTIEFDKP